MIDAPSNDEEPEWWRHGQRPAFDDFCVAVTELTVLRLRSGLAERPGRSTLFYPLIGLLLGGLWLAFDRALGSTLGPFSRALVELALWLGLSRGRQAVGWARTGAALIAGRDRQRALAAMNAQPLNIAGVICWMALAAVQLRSLTELATLRPPALLFAPLLACWTIVVLAHGSRAARVDGRLVKFAGEVSFREFAVTSVFTFGVLFSLAEATGIAVGVCVAGVTVGWRVWLHRWIGGLTPAAANGGAELAWTIVLALFATFEHHG